MLAVHKIKLVIRTVPIQMTIASKSVEEHLGVSVSLQTQHCLCVFMLFFKIFYSYGTLASNNDCLMLIII